MSRTGRIGLAALLALAATGAEAQWRADPMTVWLDRAGQNVLAASFASGAGSDDLLVLDQARDTAQTWHHHALLAPQPSTFPIGVSLQRIFRAGRLSQNGTDGLADVASHYATFSASEVQLVFGSDGSTVKAFTLPCVAGNCQTNFDGPTDGGPPYPVSFLRLLAKAQRSDALVLPYCLHSVCSTVFLMDFGAGALPTSSSTYLAAPNLHEPMDVHPEAFPVWISTTARVHDLDDVAIGTYGTVVLYTHRSFPATATPSLTDLDLSEPVVVGTTHHVATSPSWLPPTVPRFNEVRSAASLDVNLDGEPDLVFAMANPSTAVAGSLVWVEGTGSPSDFADPVRSPWHDLGLQLGLPDPVTVRPLRPAGGPAVAIWDRALQEVVVVTSVPAELRLAIWRAPAPGRFAKEIRLADLVGSPAQDLVVVMDDGAAGDKVLVYPDLGLAGPEPSWAPGSPGAPARGVPHPLAVVLDPSGPASVTVEWIENAATSAPVGTGLSHVFPPDCTLPPPPLVITVRATDSTGVFSELRATLPISTLQPALALAGASPPGRLVLPPGGTTAVFDGTVATGCGAASYIGAWPAAATVTDTPGSTWLRRTVVLPEAAYPALLADPALVVTLATTDAVPQPVVSLPLELDASGLVEVTHAADRAALADGELTVVRTRLRSRLGVALTGVRVVDALAGLAPAGPPVVSGAVVVSAAAGGADLVLDVLPAAPGEVTIELPVRAVGARGASAVAASSTGGWPLTPHARAEAAAPLPGCGCAAGSAPGALALLALALAARRRRAT